MNSEYHDLNRRELISLAAIEPLSHRQEEELARLDFAAQIEWRNHFKVIAEHERTESK